MVTMALRVDELDAELIRRYVEFEGQTISEFIRQAVFEKIEDVQDLQDLRAAIKSDSGERFTHEEVIRELGL